jgi:polyhydroxyalkanoate synthesis regulator phasin
MGNRLFQEARKFVDLAKNCEPGIKNEAISKAKNALSSAFANSTFAEQRQLHELQKELDQLHS